MIKLCKTNARRQGLSLKAEAGLELLISFIQYTWSETGSCYIKNVWHTYMRKENASVSKESNWQLARKSCGSSYTVSVRQASVRSGVLSALLPSCPGLGSAESTQLRSYLAERDRGTQRPSSMFSRCFSREQRASRCSTHSSLVNTP